MAASNITGQTLKQDSTINFTSMQQNDQGSAKTVSNITDQAYSLPNPCGPLSGQSVGQQNPVTRVNEVTPTLDPLSQAREKDKLIYQQRLALLLHAYNCKKRVGAKGETSKACNKAQCRGMKQVLRHIQVCNAAGCTVPHCNSSKAIALHWKNCKDNSCDLCSPFKQTNAYKQKTALVCQQNQSNPIQNHPVVETTNLSGNSNCVIDSQGIENQQSLQKPVDGKVPEQIIHNLKGDNPSTSGAAETSVKEWHRHINKEFRLSMIGRLIKEILSTLNREDLNDPHDPSFINVVEYARRSEQKLYETADTRDDYYQVVAEKLYQIIRKREQNLGSPKSATSSSPMNQTTSSSPKTPDELKS